MTEVRYSVLKWRDQGSLPAFDLRYWNDGHQAQFNALMVELTKLGSGKPPRTVTRGDILRWAADGSATYVIVGTVEDEVGNQRLVSTATLLALDKPTGFIGHVDEVVIAEAYQGKGLARPLMAQVHALARYLVMETLELTSAPQREAANALYIKLGYVRRDTNLYRLKL